MTRNEAAFRIASAVAATLVCYLVLEVVTKNLDWLWKTLIVCAVLAIALAIAFLSGQKKDVDEKGHANRTDIATNIASKGHVIVDGISADGTEKDVTIGSKLSAEKDVSISNVEVGKRKDRT